MSAMITLTDMLYILPILALFFSSLLVLFIKVFNKNKEISATANIFLALTGLLGAGIILQTYNIEPVEIFSSTLIIDGFTLKLIPVIILATICMLIYSRDSFDVRKDLFSEYIFLILNSVIGMFVITAANNLIVLFIGIEVMSLCLYLIIAMGNEDTSKEAAIKYFILGGFASALFLLGISFVYGATGTVNLTQLGVLIPDLISSNFLLVLGVALVFIGLLFKVAVAPFHAWAPDVYEGAATPVAAFMATTVKMSCFVALLRWCISGVISGDTSGHLWVGLQWFAAISIVWGSIAALGQFRLKRIIAFSGLSHAGFLFMGTLAAGKLQQIELYSHISYYLVAYLFMSISAFGIVHLLERKAHSVVTIEDLKGLAQKAPLLCFFFTIVLLSLAGVPPLIGFYAKLLVIKAALSADMFWLAFWAVVGSMVSIYYYLKPVVYMYLIPPEKDLPYQLSKKPMSLIVVAITTGILFFAGIFVNPVLSYFSF